jgi:hypothetical protein
LPLRIGFDVIVETSGKVGENGDGFSLRGVVVTSGLKCVPLLTLAMHDALCAEYPSNLP